MGGEVAIVDRLGGEGIVSFIGDGQCGGCPRVLRNIGDDMSEKSAAFCGDIVGVFGENGFIQCEIRLCRGELA